MSEMEAVLLPLNMWVLTGFTVYVIGVSNMSSMHLELVLNRPFKLALTSVFIHC